MNSRCGQLAENRQAVHLDEHADSRVTRITSAQQAPHRSQSTPHRASLVRLSRSPRKITPKIATSTTLSLSTGATAMHAQASARGSSNPRRTGCKPRQHDEIVRMKVAKSGLMSSTPTLAKIAGSTAKAAERSAQVCPWFIGRSPQRSEPQSHASHASTCAMTDALVGSDLKARAASTGMDCVFRRAREATTVAR